MMEQKILLLGNPVLYEVSTPVAKSDIPQLVPVIQDLHDTLMAFRKKYHAGRAIAAPQIGIKKRILYMCIDKPVIFLNPVLEPVSKETMEVMDDCMSFPNLLVKVLRYKKCKITYRDLQWQKQEMLLEGDVSELLQHEYDHLDGILATMRAMDPRSFYLKETY
ncbi:MAG: peptide deformylase [Megasphaera sp.]|jgi:peptide deformylase|nr:peptide deformylase [Megasphaera sp.]MCH4217845.1 peptide deformylase [Megasphaera sp.]